MVLGDVEETVTTVEVDEETFEEIYKVNTACDILSRQFSSIPCCHLEGTGTLLSNAVQCNPQANCFMVCPF